MNRPICIYFGEKTFWISSELTNDFKNLSISLNNIILENPSDSEILQAIQQMDSGKLDSAIIIGAEMDENWQKFKQNFTYLEAGGGLVRNEKAEVLFILRRGYWDLPKGKLDEGETIEACAIREVMEETGLKSVILESHLCNTYHVYHERGQFMLKKSVWFNMLANSFQPLVPQTSEQIEQIKWLAPAAWEMVLSNTFPSIRDVLSASGQTIKNP